MTNQSLDNLAKELNDLLFRTKENMINEMAKYLAIMLLEARLEEIEDYGNDSNRVDQRIEDLQNQIRELKGK